MTDRESHDREVVFQNETPVSAQEVEDLVGEIYRGDEYLNYFLNEISYECNDAFDGYLVLDTGTTVREDANPEIYEAGETYDGALLQYMIDHCRDWSEPLSVHYTGKPDPDALVFAAEIAFDNDVLDLASMPDYYYSTTYEGNDGLIMEYRCSFAPDVALREQKRAELKSAAEEKLKEFQEELDGLSDWERYRFLAHAVCDLTVYDDDLAAAVTEDEMPDEFWFRSTAYGAFVEGRTVCSGYAGAYKALCDLAELPCFIVNGEAPGDRGIEPHSWNAVLLDGEIFYVDPTYMDSGWGDDYCLFRSYDIDGRTQQEGWILPWDNSA